MCVCKCHLPWVHQVRLVYSWVRIVIMTKKTKYNSIGIIVDDIIQKIWLTITIFWWWPPVCLCVPFIMMSYIIQLFWWSKKKILTITKINKVHFFAASWWWWWWLQCPSKSFFPFNWHKIWYIFIHSFIKYNWWPNMIHKSFQTHFLLPWYWSLSNWTKKKFLIVVVNVKFNFISINFFIQS